MSDFLRFLDGILKDFPMHIEIGYNKTCDWGIYIYIKGCAQDYPNSGSYEEDAIMVNV